MKNNTELKASQRQNMFEQALGEFGLRYWEYDIKTHELYRSKLVQDDVGYSEYKSNVPESFVEEGIIHPDYAQAYLDFYRDIQNGENKRLMFQMKTEDGSWGWLDISYKVLFDENGIPAKAVGVGGRANTSEIVEKQLKKTEEKKMQIEKILENTAIYEYDILSYVNGNTLAFLSYTMTENGKVIEGDNYEEFLFEKIDRLHYYDADRMKKLLSKEHVLKELDQRGEYRVCFKGEDLDGNRFEKKYSYFYTNRESKRILATVRNITDLMLQTEEHEKALAYALNDAKEANQAKSVFLSRMSHDIRTPMNAILGLTSLSMDEENLSDTMIDNLKKIQGSSRFLLGLINDILDMSKIEEGAVVLQKEPYTYADFLNNIRTMFETKCNEKSISFQIEEGNKIEPVIMVDSIRWNQIFFNIISNAVKYTPEGGTIKCFINNHQSDGVRGEADFIIEDTGIGMSKKFQEKMFEPFSREEKEETKAIQGTGLGLSITKNLVNIMGGMLFIESEPGEGTKVTVHMPYEICKDDMVEMKKKNILNLETLHNKRILIVEDHPLNAEIETKLLERQKMIVTWADNGEKALEKIQEDPEFDIILMDIRMPVMGGLEATRQIRALQDEYFRKVPIIAMTGNAYSEDAKKSKDAGMNGHLSKPIEPEKLYQTIIQQLKE